MSYLPHGGVHLNISTATRSLLIDIWGVQAASVTLVFALAVFVFGLLQGRRRLAYRAFLRRTMALPLATFNVASLLFNGMVLLGLGHQGPGTGSRPGGGWAVTEASVIALASIGTIVIVLAGTLRAIDPETESDVQREYRETATAMAVRGELFQDKSVEIMHAEDWPAEFNPVHFGPGQVIAFKGPGQGVVYDVSTWKLRVISRLASFVGRSAPVVQAWPGKLLSTGAALLTVDQASTKLECWWARWSIRGRVVRSDQFGAALGALHGETLEHTRGAKPAEAVAGMRAFGDLQQLVWDGYAACGRVYRAVPGSGLVRTGRGPGEEINERLDDLLRAAAVSRDAAIQREASGLPRVIAREALYKEVPAAVHHALGSLEGVYVAVVGDLSDDGGHSLAATGLAQSRLDAPFGSLLSFVNYLAQAIDQAASGGDTGWDRRRLPPADFLLEQLQAANEAMLSILRRAVRYGDSATALRALAAWKMPDLPLARNAAELQVGHAAGTELPRDNLPRGLMQSLADAETGLNARLLRLFVTVLDADQAQQANEALPAAGAYDSTPAPDRVAQAILARLPNGSLWDLLEAAIKTSDRDWTWQVTDDEISVSGTATVRSIDTLGPLTQAFALAAIACPPLVAGPAPGDLALTRGPSLVTAADQVLASRKQWLQRHDCPPDTAAHNADSLKEKVRESGHAASSQQEHEIRTSPVRADVADKVAQLARTTFHEHDIPGIIFARAGKTASGGEDTSPITLAINTDRRPFTSADNPEWAIDSLGKQLGAGLAAMSLQLVALAAARGTEARTISRGNAAWAIREAIAEVSRGDPARPRRHPAASRTVVLIPDFGYTDRNALQIERATQNGALTDAAGKALRRFGLEQAELAVQVPGTIDGVPVIETSLRDRNVVAIDLARFGELRREAPEPEFALYQAPDPLRPTADGVSASVVGNPPTLLQVQISLSQRAGIKVNDASAVRVITLQ